MPLNPTVARLRAIRHQIGEAYRNTSDFGLRFGLQSAVALARSEEAVVDVPGLGDVRVRSADSDMAVVRQIYGARDYDLSKFGQFAGVQDEYRRLLREGLTPLIIDAGAYIGVSSMYFADVFPEASVVAIEPNPSSARLCAANVASRPNVRLMKAALGGEAGHVEIEFAADERSWGAKTERSETGAIPVLTIPQLVEDAGERARLFAVKIDIEGFESDVFERDPAWMNDASVLIVEIHDWLFPGRGTSRSLLRAIGDFQGEMVISGENLVFFTAPPLRLVRS